MGARKGTRPPNAGKGRVKGTPNKVTRELKVMIEVALENAGGVEYLQKVAKKNPAWRRRTRPPFSHSWASSCRGI